MLLNRANAIVENGEKVCFIGKNGCGKTTLIKTIFNAENEGIKIGNSQKIGYMSQIIEFKDK